MTTSASRLYSFSSFILNLTSGCLLKAGQEIKLRPKSFRLLQYLLENRGRLVGKDELIQAVWPDSFVTPNSLVKCVKDIRLALGDDSSQIIRTVARRGYIFIAAVSEEERVTAKPIVETGAGVRILVREGEATTAQTLKSIAILPFILLDGGDEHLGLAIADALITRFSKVRRMIVRPTGAIIKYGRGTQDPLAAGKDLGVDLLVEGSIQRSGERMRVTARLLRVRDGAPVWADQFHENLLDIFNAQDSISVQIAEAVTLNLTAEERNLLTRRLTKDLEAYHLYLRGRYFFNQMTEENLRRAIGIFEQAIARDPGYAMAYTGIADSYLVLGSWAAGAMPPREAYPKAKSAALRALELDPALAEAHTSMAAVVKVFDWDWAEAEKGFRRAIELDPSYPTAHQWYAMYLSAMGRLPEALDEVRLAHGLAPLSHIISRDMGRVYLFACQYCDAIQQLEHTLEMEPNFVPALFFLGTAYAVEKRYGEALAVLQKAVDVSGGKPHLLAALGHTYAACGQIDAALRTLDGLREQAKRRYVSPYNFAVIYAGLGEVDRAFAYLEKTYEERSNWLVFLRGEPRLSSLRQDPRLVDLIRRVGLTQLA
jgi:DNA-binding winged helix-turn-helix (wHTH) protein/tetratricopeptide (TPR) repeat protein